MKELDFDELDRAVNSLMGTVSSSAPNQAVPSETTTAPASDTVTQSLTEDVVPTPNSDVVNPIVLPTPSASQSIVPSRGTVMQTPPATRRTGRFMDVVHPSVDMTKAAPQGPAAPQPVQPVRDTTMRPARGLTLTPLSSAEDIKRGTDPRPVFAGALHGTPQASKTTLPAPNDATQTRAENEWPDPLEMKDLAAESSSAPLATAETEVTSPTTEQGPSGVDMAPLTSPFLPDAKVEKRPLGGAATPEPVTEPDHTPVLGGLASESVAVSDPNDQLTPAVTEDVPVELPAELHSDLVAIESNQVGEVATAPAPVAAPTPQVAEEVTAPTPKPVTPEPVPATTHSHVSASIAQQYDEQPSTGEQHHGAIYDATNFHQPLAHPAKKKSGWLIPLVILIILFGGVGLGAAVYFLDPTLLVNL